MRGIQYSVIFRLNRRPLGILDRPPSRTMTDDGRAHFDFKQPRRHNSAFPRRDTPGFCINIVPQRGEGAARPSSEGTGNAGCAARTRSPCAKGSKHTIVTTGTAASRHSPHNGVTAYSALSPVIGRSCHRHQRDTEVSSPTWRQRRGVKTTRLRRPHRRASSARADPSIAFQPTFVTIAIRPSCRAGTAALIELILANREAEYFLGSSWTRKSVLRASIDLIDARLVLARLVRKARQIKCLAPGTLVPPARLRPAVLRPTGRLSRAKRIPDAGNRNSDVA
jgi:hypothetical protein